MSDDDRDILAGISVMVYAVANREDLADQEQDQPDEAEPMPCGSQDPDDPTRFCTKEVGHSGRHKYRPLDSISRFDC